MVRSTFIVMFLLVIASGSAATQSDPVTPVVPIVTATPRPEDARLSVCAAPTLGGFRPYIIRPGDRLADLLVGVPNISVTQLAALNCIDDPAALPVGAVVWLPERPGIEVVGEADSSTDEPEIIELSASDDTVENQAGVTFNWQTRGHEGYFYACPADSEAACSRPTEAQPIPLTYDALTISGFQYAGKVRYRLEVVGGGETVTQDVEVEITCSQPFLGDFNGFRACPLEPPRAVFAAWQPFQGGVMLWFSDTQQIWVMTNGDHRVQIFDDPFVEGQADPDVTPPEGFFTPTRGFGQIWQTLGGAEGGLGWALAAETGFDSARQPASQRSYTTYIQGPDKTVYAVTVIPQIDVGLWTQVDG